MLEKTIKQVLTKKVNDWLDSVTDVELQREIRRNIIISGGAITSLVLNEVPNDYDVYFTNRDTAKRVMQYYCKIWNEKHVGKENKIGRSLEAYVLDGKEFKTSTSGDIIWPPHLQGIITRNVNISNNGDVDSYDPTVDMTRNIMGLIGEDRLKIWIPSDGVVAEENNNGVDNNYYTPEDMNLVPEELLDDADSIDSSMLEDNKSDRYRPVFMTSNAISLSNGIQLITRFYGTPEEIHKNFDFLHAKSYWDSFTNEIVIDAKAYEAIINKTLYYTGSLYPICSMFRIRKFIQRGWKINAAQVLKMAWQISELDLKNIDVLEEQLVGVDSLYFVHLIDALRQKQLSDPIWDITQEYVTTIVDKVFA